MKPVNFHLHIHQEAIPKISRQISRSSFHGLCECALNPIYQYHTDEIHCEKITSIIEMTC